ncbi:hypothetical protein ACWEVP_45165 [Amycolatopsis sp. NPDC003865]
MNGKVFVNYRQRNAADELLPHALLVEALADQLAVYFGREAVYFDTTLRVGEPYPAALRARLAETGVLVVVIHPTWLSDLADRSGRHRDWVHDEIATALENGIRLVPVVLAGATMPKRHELPATIGELAHAQGVELRFGSLAAGVQAVVAEIELVVSPRPPELVVRAEPLPDRSRVGAAAGVFLLSVLLGGANTAVGFVPFPRISAVWNAALFAGVPTFYLLIGLFVSGCRFALRRPMDWLDERLARTPNRAFVVFGLGVFLLGLVMVALMLVSASGLDAGTLTLALTIALGAVLVMAVAWLRNQARTPDWPERPAVATPFWVRRACVELETRLRSWTAPLPLAQQRDAQVALAGIRGAVAALRAPETSRLVGWWRKRSPWVTLPHIALAASATVLATLALVLDWVADGPDVVSAAWWLGAVIVIAGCYLGAIAFEYGCDRSQIKTIETSIEERLASLEDQLAVLSRPGLIAPHRLRPSGQS